MPSSPNRTFSGLVIRTPAIVPPLSVRDETNVDALVFVTDPRLVLFRGDFAARGSSAGLSARSRTMELAALSVRSPRNDGPESGARRVLRQSSGEDPQMVIPFESSHPTAVETRPETHH